MFHLTIAALANPSAVFTTREDPVWEMARRVQAFSGVAVTVERAPDVHRRIERPPVQLSNGVVLPRTPELPPTDVRLTLEPRMIGSVDGVHAVVSSWIREHNAALRQIDGCTSYTSTAQDRRVHVVPVRVLLSGDCTAYTSPLDRLFEPAREESLRGGGHYVDYFKLAGIEVDFYHGYLRELTPGVDRAHPRSVLDDILSSNTLLSYELHHANWRGREWKWHLNIFEVGANVPGLSPADFPHHLENRHATIREAATVEQQSMIEQILQTRPDQLEAAQDDSTSAPQE